jgi:hypothetical protein
MVAKADVQPDTMYKLKVTRTIPYGPSGRTFLTPASEIMVKGKVISELADADIESIEDADQPPA